MTLCGLGRIQHDITAHIIITTVGHYEKRCAAMHIVVALKIIVLSLLKVTFLIIGNSLRIIAL